MNHEIKDIFKLYESILSHKNVLSEQVDIYGIDELVYNPATKKGGPIGYGYDGGKKIAGITWKKHWDHLHVGFTNRDVAIDVINKANEMGLKNSENLIAKRDGNGYLDDVHADSSFHYKLFPGEPQVTAGLDVSGDKNTIIEFMEWIISKYGKDDGYSYQNPGFLSSSWSELVKLVPIETKGKHKGQPVIDNDIAIAAALPGELPVMTASLKTKPEVTSTDEVTLDELSVTDKSFYEELLKNLGAPVSPENLKFLLAWRQAEGQGGKFNPFNTTWKLPNSTTFNSHGVQNYQSLEDGMSATLKTLNNGRYSCIVDGLKKNIGAAEIAQCPSLEVWGTGDLVGEVIASYEKGNPIKVKSLQGGQVEIPSDELSIVQSDNAQEIEKGDPILRMMAQSIFKENTYKRKRLFENIDRIKGLI